MEQPSLLFGLGTTKAGSSWLYRCWIRQCAWFDCARAVAPRYEYVQRNFADVPPAWRSALVEV